MEVTLQVKDDTRLFRKDGTESTWIDVTSDKIVAYYFSAKWCPACQSFTPKLSEVYQELAIKRKLQFDVVFISYDKTEKDMKMNMEETHGNWWAVEFDSPVKEELREQFEIDLVPKLILMNSTNQIITRKGRKEVEDRGVAAYNHWSTAAELLSAKLRAAAAEQAAAAKAEQAAAATSEQAAAAADGTGNQEYSNTKSKEAVVAVLDTKTVNLNFKKE